MEWISVEDRLPKYGRLLLVRLDNWNLPAMAVFVGETIEGYWKVQPLFSKWYATNDKVTHWADPLVDQWIDIEDRLPEPYETVLVYLSDEEICGGPTVFGRWDGEQYWNGHTAIGSSWIGGRTSVSRWMPLPGPPEGWGECDG
jgi:hypothetical protein